MRRNRGTLFMVTGALLLIVLATGSYIDGLFGFLIVFNSIVGIIQEVRDLLINPVGGVNRPAEFEIIG